MNIAPVLQQQVVLDEGGQGEVWNDLVQTTFQEDPEPAAGQVLQGPGSLGQGEQGLVEVLVLLRGDRTTITGEMGEQWTALDY